MLQVPCRTIMEDKSDLSSHIVYSMEIEDVEIEPNLALDNKAFDIVKLDMPEDSATSPDQFPHTVPDFQQSKIKTESIIHPHQVCDVDTTNDDVRHTIERNIICVKHEYTFEDDRTHVMSHTEEAGTSVVVTSGMPYDFRMPTSDNVLTSRIVKSKRNQLFTQNRTVILTVRILISNIVRSLTVFVLNMNTSMKKTLHLI
jgi:hypothetical protein